MRKQLGERTDAVQKWYRIGTEPVLPVRNLSTWRKVKDFTQRRQRKSGEHREKFNAEDTQVSARRKKMRATVFTIGHSTRPLPEFIAMLRAHSVERVADVRSIPRSRYNPQFNRETLARRLRAARIGYVHLKKLGGLRHAKADSANLGWHNASFRGFADYMQTEDFLSGLARLEKLAIGKPTAIMCAEAVPWRCHRSLIADALVVRDFSVEDIMSVARASEHEITPFARVRGLRITYPTDKAAKR
jgi:Protein of unknown function, DUF488